MTTPDAFPENARCLGCDYALRGLPTNVCPECGRAFDPSDATTYETRPLGWRRRLWKRRGIAAVLVCLALALFAPRGVLKSEITFACSMCGRGTRYYRYELQPPSWIRWRYPGVSGPVPFLSPQSVPTTGCIHPQHDVAVRFDFRLGGFATGSSQGPTIVNDELASLDTAEHLLWSLLSPGTNGISICGSDVLDVRMSPDDAP